MAAFDTPWTIEMAQHISTAASSNPLASTHDDANPTTTATFSPAQSVSSYQRRSVLVHKNTPLLIATPPQVTRALAFSHPFLLPLSKFVGLLSWSTSDSWESFLLVAAFWAVTLFGKDIIRYAGPVLAVVGLMAGMYARRYSPLSTRVSEGKTKGHRSRDSENMRHQKSFDEIVETLNVFTARCNIMLNPLLELTDFLSTQQTATSASTGPALTNLFIRLLMTLPLWIALTLPPLRIITAQRVVLVVGTVFLTWHSRPARISRTILWRNLSVRYIVSLLTGLEFASNTGASSAAALLLRKHGNQQTTNATVTSGETGRSKNTVRFTFNLYENQRRWLGIGWTSSMFAYERAAWTDENLNTSSPKEKFHLPAVEGGAKWRWVPGSEWRIETTHPSKEGEKTKANSAGWIYYDNNWNDPRRQDGWNRYTRRRKWYRDAELVDIELDTETGAGLKQPAARKNAGTLQKIVTGSANGDAGLTELPASAPEDAQANSSAFTNPHLLSPISAVMSTTGTDASSTLVDGDGKAETASLRSNASSTTRVRRHGLLRRRSNSRDTRNEDHSHEVRSPRSRAGGDSEERRSMEEGQEWLVGDDVRMGLS